ncbi:hydroxyethylthiazole kinase [Peptoniphilus equinus]|uniref:Multifunctional fusion protein n=1 Tax=Peptoniphilus equinus TaxID=3016343 RepID=A0ABY7QUS3_9FIRM|nr:hydroxyethylthiazole kinase [Peptoniphilus equinus]WBW49780.1 hydroxyethylthiazole kinase [Peptoniphilus equinus]
MTTLDCIRNTRPLIHCFTGTVTSNDVANALLAIGASPFMGEAEEDLSEILAVAKGLYINLAGITRKRYRLMRRAVTLAHEHGVPVTLDAVGAGSTVFRTTCAKELLAMGVTLLHGNASELAALVLGTTNTKGVDSDKLSCDLKTLAHRASTTFHTIVVLSGPTDYIADGKDTLSRTGGSAMMPDLTGTGCILSGLLCAAMSASVSTSSAVEIVDLMNAAGAYAESRSCGMGDFHRELFNGLSRYTQPHAPKTRASFDPTLYLITDNRLFQGDLLSAVEAALQGGVSLVQLRDKSSDTRDITAVAKALLTLCRRYDVPLLIDDRVDVAMAVGADGVHLGQKDLPVAAARKLLGPDAIIGATAKTVDAALDAQRQGADYLGVGALFTTITHSAPIHTTFDTLRAIHDAVTIPLVGIGGINETTAPQLKGLPMEGYAVATGILLSDDPEATSTRLKSLFLKGAHHE